MSKDLEDLVGFLHSPQAAIREIAIENLVGYSAAGQNQKIFHHDNFRSIKDLKILARDAKVEIVRHALTILSNLCDNPQIRTLIIDDDSFVKYIISQLVNLQNYNADLMCILLTNIAKDDKITKVFDIIIDEKDINKPGSKESFVFKSNKAMDCIMDLFVNGSERTLNTKADFDYLAYFFADISRFPKGRHYFVTLQDYDGVVPLSKILVFTEKYDAKTRREGVSSTIKNSLFDTERHMTLLTDENINLLPYILLPIASPGNKGLSDDEMFELPDELQLLPEDKKREPLKEIMAVHLESILLLCVSKEVREYLRTKSVYPIIRELHKDCDEDEFIMELCDRIVQMLMRDEAPSNAEIDAMHSDNESDEDDDRITEVA